MRGYGLCVKEKLFDVYYFKRWRVRPGLTELNTSHQWQPFGLNQQSIFTVACCRVYRRAFLLFLFWPAVRWLRSSMFRGLQVMSLCEYILQSLAWCAFKLLFNLFQWSRGRFFRFYSRCLARRCRMWAGINCHCASRCDLFKYTRKSWLSRHKSH